MTQALLKCLGLGVSARFLQLSPEEHLRKVKSLGLPDDLAVAVNQLQEALPLEQAVMEATGIVQGNKVNAILSLLCQIYEVH